MIGVVSGVNGLAVGITLALVAAVWFLLTMRSSRPKNH